MAKYLEELSMLKDKYGVPLFCTGDIFHKWNSPAELVNFALEYLPPCFAIAGNHDLPNHRLEDISKSSYYTLFKAGLIQDLSHGNGVWASQDVYVHGFPWGAEIVDPNSLNAFPKTGTRLALIHVYIWWGPHKYPDASPDSYLARFIEPLKHFDAAAFGDNHKGFYCSLLDPSYRLKGIFNNGGFYRAKSDEIDYRPRVGLLYADGRIREHFLNHQDEWVDDLDAVKQLERYDDGEAEASKFVTELARLGDQAENFKETVHRLLTTMTLSDEVKTLVQEALEKGDNA